MVFRQVYRRKGTCSGAAPIHVHNYTDYIVLHRWMNIENVWLYFNRYQTVILTV